MSRPEPRFSAGEEVVYLSQVISPGRWLCAVIAEAEYKPNGWIGRNTGKKYQRGWAYLMFGQSWAPESHIRKKPKLEGSNQSYTELMSSLKSGQVVRSD